jgi:hypothetical protein
MKSLLLAIILSLLTIDSAIEIAFISNTVSYLHRSRGHEYPFDLGNGTSATINAEPARLLLNEGHISNSAAATSLVGTCFGGYLVLWMQRRREQKEASISAYCYKA